MQETAAELVAALVLAPSIEWNSAAVIAALACGLLGGARAGTQART
jgi:hypothetical protein